MAFTLAVETGCEWSIEGTSSLNRFSKEDITEGMGGGVISVLTVGVLPLSEIGCDSIFVMNILTKTERLPSGNDP
jgi:hypothetical protein